MTILWLSGLLAMVEWTDRIWVPIIEQARSLTSLILGEWIPTLTSQADLFRVLARTVK